MKFDYDEDIVSFVFSINEDEFKKKEKRNNYIYPFNRLSEIKDILINNKEINFNEDHLTMYRGV